MNRKTRRKLGLTAGNPQTNILAAQRISRAALVHALIGWTGLLGAELVEPNSQAILTKQRDGKPVVVTVTIAVRPATAEDRGRPYGEPWAVPTYFVAEGHQEEA